MRLFIICIFLLSASFTHADNILERLKSRYQAIEKGKVELPQLTKSRAIPTSPDTNVDSQNVLIPSGEELIITLYFDKHLLGDILGVKTDSGAAFSLLDIATVLDFPITLQTQSPQAQGWIRTPENTFSLEITKNGSQVTIGDTSFPVKDGDIVDFDELYIDQNALEEWFDIQFNTNFQELKSYISSTSPLPLQQKIERQSRAQSIQPLTNTPQNPLTPNEYSPLSLPLVDIQASTTFSESKDSSSSLSILGGNDLAYFNTQYYLSSNTQVGLTAARFQASRTSIDAGLLGPLQATIVELGDIRPTRINNVLNSSNAVGLRISNENIGALNTNTINLYGDIQPGWDIEIYRNSLLIASNTNIEGGRYSFDNLPLSFGSNTVEIVFYGPQGQIEREVKNYYVNSIGQGAGSFVYDVSLYEDGEELFDSFLENQIVRETYGSTLSGQGRFALTDWFSVNFGQQEHLDSKYQQHDRQSIGATASILGKALLTSSYITAPDESSIEEHTLTTELFDQAIEYSTYRRRSYNDDENEWQTDQRDELNLSGRISPLKVSYQQDIERKQVNGIKSYGYKNQISASVGKIYINHEIEWGSDNDNKDGRWQLQKYIDGYFARIGSSYTINPKLHTNGIYAEISGAPFENIQAQASVSRNLDSEVNSVALSTSWRPNDFSVRSRLAYNDLTGWSANLSGQISVGQTNQGFFASNRALVSQGSVSVFVFHDKNNNGVYDNLDAALPNIRVLSKQSIRRAETDYKGIAVLKSLPNYKQTDIEVDEGSVTIPYLITRGKGVSVIPRSSIVQHIEIPMVTSYEIEGSVLELTPEKSAHPTAFVTVQLLNSSKEVVDEVDTEFDGYYVFTNVLPEQHYIRVAPSFLDKRNYLPQQARPVRLNEAKDNILYGENIYIRKESEIEGFSSQIRTFASLGALRSYWTILRKRQPQLLSYQYFYKKHEETYALYIGFSEERIDAQKTCNDLSRSGLMCVVKNIIRH